MGVPSQFKATPCRGAGCRRRRRSYARCLARARTRARPFAPPRPALPRPGGRTPVDQPHIRRDLVSKLGPTMEEPEAWLQLLGGSEVIFMGSLTQFLRKTPPSRLGPFHGRGGPSGCSRGRLEATAAVLTGAASIWTTERLLRMWSAPPVEPLPDLLALPSTSGMTRGTRSQWFFLKPFLQHTERSSRHLTTPPASNSTCARVEPHLH